MIKIYTDGSAHPNPGPGGYGVIVRDNDDNLIEAHSRQYAGPVTNNEMELKAILYSMINYGKSAEPVIIYSDSAYCISIFTNWMYSWYNNGWRKGNGDAPENLELIKAFFELEELGYKVKFEKVKGHRGNSNNELADALATGKINIDFL